MYVTTDYYGHEKIILDSTDEVIFDDDIARRNKVLHMDGENRYQIEVVFNENVYKIRRSIADEVKKLGENIPGADTFDEAMDIAKSIFMKYIQREDVIREKDSTHRYVTILGSKYQSYEDCGTNFIDEIRILDKAGNDEYHINVPKWIDTYVMLEAMGIISEKKSSKTKKVKGDVNV